MLPNLDAFTDLLDSTVVEALGDALLYTGGGLIAEPIRGFVDDLESVRDFGPSSAMVAGLRVQLRVADVSVRPHKTHTIRHVASGLDYTPNSAELDGSGGWWTVNAKPAT